MGIRLKVERVIILSVLILVAFISTVPFLWVAVSSLKTNMEIFLQPLGLPSELLWRNFTKAWIVGRFGIYLMNSAIVGVFNVAAVISLSTLAGYGLARLTFRLKNTIFAAFTLGLTVPTQAIIIPVYYNLRALGLVNTYLGLILVETAIALPYSILLMRAFFISAPAELGEAARIDGCSECGVFWHIFLPLAIPAMLALTILQFMSSWKSFILPLVTLYSDEMRTIPLGLMFYSSKAGTNFNLLAAGAMIAAIPVILIYVICNRYFVEGLTVGSIKG